jgi:hypothetical protein
MTTIVLKERVRRAIEFRAPDRVPIVFWNRDQTEGDVMLYHLALGVPGDGAPNSWNWRENEWGYRLQSLGDGTMGHPVAPVYPDLPAPESIRAPALREEERMSAVPAFLETCDDRYQTVSIQGTPEEIHAEAGRLYDYLVVPAGGFIGYVEEYSVMGMSEENYRACGEAFRGLTPPGLLSASPECQDQTK